MTSSKNKKRRSKGEGSIVQRSDGRWMGRYTVMLPGGTKKRQSVILKDKQAVIARMREEMALADRGTPIVRSKRTTGEYLEYWLKYISAPRVRDITQAGREMTVKNHLMPTVGNIPLTSLRPDHIRMMLTKFEQDGKSRYVQKVAKQLLSTAIKDAVKLELVSRNVTLSVDTPKYKYKERKVWDKEQVARFLDFIKDHKYSALFEIMFHYGLRRGEVIGLRWRDIDFQKNEIHIRQTIAEVRYKLVVSEPKTKSSIRDLPLLPRVKSALLRHKLAEAKYDYADDLIFHSSIGNPVDPRSLLTTFQWLAKNAGLPKLCLHEIRHTVATLLKDAGVSPKDAQVILGHSDIATTLQIYTHSSLENQTTALNTLAQNIAL
ncbi:MAG: site-specific integrase [Candidatus Nomurabacteria bacterium]|jgi:integrase|nr:site-specific integrase [Candidatus Nomurabacteria bacterium]